MNKEEIFELIEDSSTSYGEARRLASQWAVLSEKKQDEYISFHLTFRLAGKTSRLVESGHYREAAWEMCMVPGMGMKSALKLIKRSRIESRHNRQVNVGGTGTEGYAWCKCGWKGKTIQDPGHFDKARKEICPVLKEELAKYGLKYKPRR